MFPGSLSCGLPLLGPLRNLALAWPLCPLPAKCREHVRCFYVPFYSIMMPQRAT